MGERGHASEGFGHVQVERLIREVLNQDAGVVIAFGDEFDVDLTIGSVSASSCSTMARCVGRVSLFNPWRFTMRFHGLILFTVASSILAVGVLAAAGEDEAIQKDRKQITGTWRVSPLRKTAKNDLPTTRKNQDDLQSDGKYMVQREGKTVVAGSTKIDPTKKPKQSEGTYTEGELKGMTVLGIYEIDGDNMRGCFALPGKDRPTEFSSKPGSSQVLIAYKRDKRRQRSLMPIVERKAREIITNSIGMKFVWIPPGTFMMGSPKEEERRESTNETQHKVTLTKGFYMGVITVTQEQWQAVMGNNPSEFKGEKNLPVERVSWDDCQEFIKKLREKDKKPIVCPPRRNGNMPAVQGQQRRFILAKQFPRIRPITMATTSMEIGKKGVDPVRRPRQ